MRTRIALSVLVVSLVIAFGFAQSSLGEIRGIVTDDGGAAIAGVLVTATGPEQRLTTTDKNGAFAFQNLRPGSYDLQFQLAGFRISLAKVNVSTRVEQLKMTMSVAAASAKVFQEMLRRGPGAAFRAGGGIASTGASPGGLYPSAEPAPYLPGRYDPNFNTEAYDHLDKNRFAESRTTRCRRFRSMSTRPHTPTCAGS